MKIVILGAGAYGTALGGILAQNGYDIDYYDKEVEKERLCDVLTGAKMIVLCVPSNVAPHLIPYLPAEIPLVVATKGMLTEGGLSRINDWMMLSGPGFADDIKAKQETVLTATDARVAEWFRASYMEFEITDDRFGVMMCGALKNVYAVMAGFCGLQRESTEWNKYVEQATNEVKNILAANGAEAETAMLACGIGDIKLTCGYPSRNYEYGDKLRRNPDYQPEKTVEGLSTIQRIAKGEIIVPNDTPILKEIIKKWG